MTDSRAPSTRRPDPPGSLLSDPVTQTPGIQYIPEPANYIMVAQSEWVVPQAPDPPTVTFGQSIRRLFRAAFPLPIVQAQAWVVPEEMVDPTAVVAIPNSELWTAWAEQLPVAMAISIQGTAVLQVSPVEEAVPVQVEAPDPPFLPRLGVPQVSVVEASVPLQAPAPVGPRREVRRSRRRVPQALQAPALPVGPRLRRSRRRA